LLGCLTVQAQDTLAEKPDRLNHSVYLGWATGTNVGGSVGLGVEYALNKYFTANVAIGSIHLDIQNANLRGKVSSSKMFDFDLGLKLYPIKYLFLGLNYGLINYVYQEWGYSNGQLATDYKDIRGFSYTVGLRSGDYKNLHLSAFIGTTSVKEANCAEPFGDEPGDAKFCYPHVGMLLGYTFK